MTQISAVAGLAVVILETGTTGLEADRAICTARGGQFLVLSTFFFLTQAMKMKSTWRLSSDREGKTRGCHERVAPFADMCKINRLFQAPRYELPGIAQLFFFLVTAIH